MKYFKLLIDFENNNNDIVCTSSEIFDIEQYEVMEGKYVEKWNEKNTLYFEPTKGARPTDYLSNDLGWFVISDKFKCILEELRISGVQYLPIRIRNTTNNEVLEGFSVCNIFNLVDALDLANSDYTEFELDENEKIISVKKYALKSSELNGVHIFRLAGDPFGIFVSEIVKKALIDNRITGCDFLEVRVS